MMVIKTGFQSGREGGSLKRREKKARGNKSKKR